jgi:hypothetical protein
VEHAGIRLHDPVRGLAADGQQHHLGSGTVVRRMN